MGKMRDKRAAFWDKQEGRVFGPAFPRGNKDENFFLHLAAYPATLTRLRLSRRRGHTPVTHDQPHFCVHLRQGQDTAFSELG